MRNACIPLSAISELELSSPQFSLMPQSALIIIGFVLFWTKNSVIKVIGELLLFVGGDRAFADVCCNLFSAEFITYIPEFRSMCYVLQQR